MRPVACRVLLLVFALVSVAGLSAFGGASASAEVTHDFKFSFDGSATPPGFFEGEVSAVAIDQANGDMYLADYQADAVYKFRPVGKISRRNHRRSCATRLSRPILLVFRDRG